MAHYYEEKTTETAELLAECISLHPLNLKDVYPSQNTLYGQRQLNVGLTSPSTMASVGWRV